MGWRGSIVDFLYADTASRESEIYYYNALAGNAWPAGEKYCQVLTGGGVLKAKRLIITALICVLSCFAGHAGNGGGFRYSGYSGGMMLHSGSVSAGTVSFNGQGGAFRQKMAGMPTGIGGAVRLGFGSWFRVGTEGYVSTLKYGENGSNSRIGWGGLLVDGVWKAGRLWPFAGVTIGGGSVKNLTLNHAPRLDFDAEQDVSYRKYSFMTAVPFAGVEVAVSSHMHIVFKVDWMPNLSNPQPDFPKGPRVYIGFSFCRGN